MKLNDTIYLLWVQSFRLLVRLHKKLKHITNDPLVKSATPYDDWVASDYSVITWLLNSIDEKVNVKCYVFKDCQRDMRYSEGDLLQRAKYLMWLTCMRSYFHYDKTITLYLFTILCWNGLSMSWIFINLMMLDLKVLQQYHNELAMAKFLSGLIVSFDHQVWR